MNKTANYNLNKPEYNDQADIAALNENADLIDVALAGKVDKEADKQLSTEDYTTTEKAKLAGVETGANNYTHPATHPPSIIVQDVSNRFVTDTEKAAWNAKETPAGAQAKANTAENNAKEYVGDKADLLTTEKATIVGAVNELFTDVGNGKGLIASAITDKGVSASGSDTFPTLAGKIGDIPAGGEYGTAGVAQVLEGYTIGTENGIVEGTMLNKSTQYQQSLGEDGTSTPGTVYAKIPPGFYDNNDRNWLTSKDNQFCPENIKAGTGIFGLAGNFTSDADATAAQILSEKKAYVNGSLITGTIPTKGAQTYTPGTVNQVIADGQYLTGAQTIAGSTNLLAQNIKNGVNIFGVNGTYSGEGKKYIQIDNITKAIYNNDYAFRRFDEDSEANYRVPVVGEFRYYFSPALGFNPSMVVLKIYNSPSELRGFPLAIGIKVPSSSYRFVIFVARKYNASYTYEPIFLEDRDYGYLTQNAVSLPIMSSKNPYWPNWDFPTAFSLLVLE